MEVLKILLHHDPGRLKLNFSSSFITIIICVLFYFRVNITLKQETRFSWIISIGTDPFGSRINLFFFLDLKYRLVGS